jgi:hypothetical protein
MKLVHRRAHHFLNVKEPFGSLRQANSPKADSIQRGLKLAGIRCEFHNVFWATWLFEFMLVFFEGTQGEGWKGALPGKPAVAPGADSSASELPEELR